MSWDQIVNALKDFFSQPVPIIGCTIGALAVLIFGIIKKSSIGKKSLLKLTGLYNDMTSKFELVKLEYDAKYEELKTEYENKLALISNKKDEVEELLLAIAPYIHNAKVQELIEDYNKHKHSLISISSVVEAKVEETKKYYETLLSELKAEIEKIKDSLPEVVQDEFTTK